MKEGTFENFRVMAKEVSSMDEDALRNAINYEVSTYRRKAVVERLHQRYSKLRAQRERVGLVTGKILL